MKTFYTLLFSVGLIVQVQLSIAQSRSFDNIIDMKLRNSGVLLEDEEIRGYYFFYRLDKSSKGKRNFLLRLLDQNLKDIKTTTIEESKNVMLAEAKYNGNIIMLKLVDTKEKRIKYLSFNKSAELVDTHEVHNLSVYEMKRYGTPKAPLETDDLLPIQGVGFIDYGIGDNLKGYHFYILPDDPDISNKWKYSSNNEEKGVQIAGELDVMNNTLLNVVVKKKKLKDKDSDYFIQGVDLRTGKLSFEKPLVGKFVHQPLTSYLDSEKGLVNILGVYYLEEDKTDKETGLGLFRLSVDENGNISDHKYLAYSGDFSKHVPVSRKGHIGENKSYVYFHDIINNADGSIIAVGEQYKRTADAAGIATGLLGAATGTANVGGYTKMVIEDLVLARFSPDFTINSIEFVDKTKSDFKFPGSYDFVNIHYLSIFVKAYGGFDYMFTQSIEEDNATAVCYLDYEKQDEGGKRWKFGAIILKDGQYSNDEMLLTKARSKDKIIIQRAKPGYIMVTEYIKKEKKLEVHLERLNY